jgi:hypothetical protein
MRATCSMASSRREICSTTCPVATIHDLLVNRFPAAQTRARVSALDGSLRRLELVEHRLSKIGHRNLLVTHTLPD